MRAVGAALAVALALCLGSGETQAADAVAKAKKVESTAETLRKHCRVYGPFGTKAKMMTPAPGFSCRKHGPIKYGKGGIGFGRSYICEPIPEYGFKFGVNAVCEL